MGKIDLPHDPILAGKVVDSEAEKDKRKLEGGFMGRIFGLSKEKPGNIAALSVVISFIMFGCVLIWGRDEAGLSKKDQLLMVSGFITLSLGFVFGRSSA